MAKVRFSPVVHAKTCKQKVLENLVRTHKETSLPLSKEV